jgi:hypothetical protein
MGQIVQNIVSHCRSNKIDANNGVNDRNQYSTNINPLANLKPYMPPSPCL